MSHVFQIVLYPHIILHKCSRPRREFKEPWGSPRLQKGIIGLFIYRCEVEFLAFVHLRKQTHTGSPREVVGEIIDIVEVRAIEHIQLTPIIFTQVHTVGAHANIGFEIQIAMRACIETELNTTMNLAPQAFTF